MSELAPREARRLRHKQVREEHVLLGIVAKENRGFLNELVVASIFTQYRVDLARLTGKIENQLRDTSEHEQNPSHTLRSLEAASLYEARQLKHGCVGTEHILLAVLRDEGGSITGCLAPYGLTYNALRADLAGRPGL